MVCSTRLIMEVTDEGKYEVYCKLKNKIIHILEENYKLEDLKTYFARDIESPRDLSFAKTVSDIIYLLEERDVLSHHNILPLFYLGKSLNDESIIKFTMVYKNIYMNDNNNICSCGVIISYTPPKLSPQTDDNIQEVNAHFFNSADSELQEALKIVSKRIGEHWPVLISELKVYQSQLDLVFKNHPKDTEAQAYQALQYWVKNEKGNATIEALDKALNARLCKRKGIGSHLREPIVDIT